MRFPMSCYSLAPMALACSIGLSPAAAEAATQRAHYYAATAVCESPLPVYDATLRKRPLGIANDGNTVIFISCSMPGDYAGDMTSATVQIGLTGLNGGGTVNCTLVAGNRPWGSVARAGSAVVPANETVYISWANVDKADFWGSYNFSCNVPPGVEMNHLVVVQFDEDGQL